MAETKAPAKSTTTRKTATKKPAAEATPETEAPSSARFAKAIDEARAGAEALSREAQEKAGAYREKARETAEAYREKAMATAGAYREQAMATGGELLEEAKAFGEQARVRASELANEGKTKASDAISSLGQIVADNAGTIDDKLGPKYGDYARSAARTMQETAAKIEAKDLNELGDDAKEFVRKSPGLAVGMAAVAGFMIARLFRKADD